MIDTKENTNATNQTMYYDLQGLFIAWFELLNCSIFLFYTTSKNLSILVLQYQSRLVECEAHVDQNMHLPAQRMLYLVMLIFFF
jgi:hypothetical protein